MQDLVLLGSQAIVLVEQFLVVVVQRGSFLLQLFNLDNFGVERSLQLRLLLLYFSQLVGRVSQLGTQGLHILLQLVDRLYCQLQLQLPFFVCFCLDKE
jgi:hypothetical protein